MLLSGSTCVYGLLGDPVAHSLSPLMHNYAFHRYHLDAVYVPFRVSAAELPSAVAGLRALNIAGYNVTVPHKETILSLLDEVDLPAQLIGAVNTVVCKNGVMTGYNTDVSGFKRAFQQELNFFPAGKNSLLLGAGGACRAAVVALASSGIKSIMIANRHLGRAQKVVDAFNTYFPDVEMSATSYEDQLYFDGLADADLIVNTTSVGLKKEKINFLPLENIKGSALIFDMIYSLSETPLIKESRSLSLTCCDGLGMLAAQGEDAFSLWTGITLETGFMKRCLLESS